MRIADGVSHRSEHVPDFLPSTSASFVIENWNPAWPAGSTAPFAPPPLAGVLSFLGVTTGTSACGLGQTPSCPPDCPAPPQPPASPPNAPTKTYRFAQMGEVKWCTENAAGGLWKLKIDRMSQEVTAAFANTQAKMSRVHDHCWLAMDGGTPDTARAAKCDDGDESNPHACNFSTYPYYNNDRLCTNYNADVRSDLDHSHAMFGEFGGPHVAQVMHFDGRGSFPGTCESGGDHVCGLAETGFGGKRSVALARPAPGVETDQVAWDCKAYVPTHEFGHNFDLGHDGDVRACYPQGYACTTVMLQSGEGDIRRNEFTNGDGGNGYEVATCRQAPNCGPNRAW